MEGHDEATPLRRADIGHRAAVPQALLAAGAFGLSVPLSKVLLGSIEAIPLASFLYLGAGVGLTIYGFLGGRGRRRGSEARLESSDCAWLVGAILTGGVAAPILLLIGLQHTSAAAASLLLNLEGVLTALVAWLAFKENLGFRVLGAVIAIALGSAVLSLPGDSAVRVHLGSLLVGGACLCWAIDNNFTREVSAVDPVVVARAKGLAAGGMNLAIALALGQSLPSFLTAVLALALGAVCYGASLVLYILAMRSLGATRTAAYFGLAPFLGAAFSLGIFVEGRSLGLIVPGGLMAIGAWLLWSERHVHEHVHDALMHVHRHVHDLHHDHTHAVVEVPEAHSHVHPHRNTTHTHEHVPDIHHRHEHED